MEFRRIENLPPYVFTIINNLKIEARRNGADVVDLGFGNPDIPSPDIAVQKLAEAAQNPRNHRYSLSRGIPKLREAIAGYYKKTWDVDLDPELEITNTIGSKEGFSHLMWVLLEHGDAAIVPTPSYPIHMYGPLFAGADLRQVPIRSLSHPEARENFADDFFESLHTAYDIGWPKPRVLVISFPHNPTGASVDLPFMQRVVDFCRERDMIVVHDFAYADVGFDGVQPPSILQAEGAREVAVEQYSMTKSFSMAGWRCAFMLGNAEVVQALVKLKSYLDYGMFQPVQIASTVALNEASDFPKEICATYESRCDALLEGLTRIGWDVPKPGGTMFVWAPIPEAYSEMGSVEFCSMVVNECDVALSPGVGFGPGGEGYARFALIENEKRIQQAVRNLRRGLTKLG
jgi:alanine-synthesizing transaminase